MSSPALETLLARLYRDAALRERFLQQPAQLAREAGLSDSETSALLAIDRIGLQMAANSYAAKLKTRPPRQQSAHLLWTRWLQWLRGSN